MKILVTGATGQLGFDVMRELDARGIPAKGCGRGDFSLTDHAAARRCLEEYAPDVVVHCGAYTAVDKAEDEPELAMAVNGDATRNLAEICRDIRGKFIYISTDYVFPGEGDAFYEPEDPTGPRNVYGRSKLAGEEAVREILQRYFILRISWVFGIHGKNFIRTMLDLSKSRGEIKVVADQLGSPTYTRDLARLVADMAESENYGVYHGTNEGICSWAELAEETFRQARRPVKVIPVSSEVYPVKAARPKNSRMSKDCLDRAGFRRLPHWKDALSRYLEELAAERKD